MIQTKIGVAVAAASLFSISGCSLLEVVGDGVAGAVENFTLPEVRFDSNSYVVQPGDTLDSVAMRYDLDPAQLASANGMDRLLLLPGQELLLDRDSASALVNTRSRRLEKPVAVTVEATTEFSREPQVVAAPSQVVAAPTLPPIAESEQITGNEQIVGEVKKTDDLLADDEPVFVTDTDFNSGVAGVGTAAVGSGAVGSGAAVQQLPTIDDVRVAHSGASEKVIKEVQADFPSSDVPVSDGVQMRDERVVGVRTRDGWAWPTVGTITRKFDLAEINRQGLDIDAGAGAGVSAAADGEVVYSGKDLASYGNLVILRHEDNFLTAYSKVSDIFVKENQKVKAGDVIAVLGRNPSEGTELHFEIRRNGEPVNPVNYLPAL